MSDNVDAGGVVAAQPLLRPLLHNWAKGERLAFLEGYISDYKEGLLSKKKSASVLDAIVNQWFTRFHWSIPLSANDNATATVFALDSQGHEILGSADSILKGRVIERARTSLYHWYEYRCKRMTSLLPRPSKGKKDNLTLLVEKFLGRSASSSRRSAGWEVWGKEHFPSMKADFEAEFAASGRPKSARLLEPAEAQAVYNELPNLFGTLIHVIGEAVGMHITVLIGGPEPKRKGQLNMVGLSIHAGENKAPIPKVWAHAEKEKFAAVSEVFLTFLSTCYTADEQRARALPQPVTDADPMHAGPSSSTPAPDPSTENSTKPSNSSGLADSGRKRKRSAETNVKKVQKSRLKAKKGSIAKKKPTKRRKTTADAEASATDSASEDSDPEHSGEDDDEDEDEGDEDEDEDEDQDEDEDEPQTMTRKSTRNTSMDPRRWKGAKADVDTIKINVSTAFPSPSNTSALPSPPTAHSLPSPPVDPPVIPPRTPSMPGGSLLATSPPPAPSSNDSPTSVSGAQAYASWPPVATTFIIKLRHLPVELPFIGISFTGLGVFIAFFIINGILGAFIAFFIINPV
ncbi:uncharacterized protein LACBIDRAFT_335964 [Laccaria bicolor S238N-H82]|uniref:Predicted protein n=1 Tax=Laccaria bicolor (strain S238N-H82 / ATCC MYA-4686) TaxID=486041 RepID=B0E3Z3_LACBS|nr:uncharacterized protein LACBIDRAFT_335964 [Laccaria bicolor S238N-H82]EDQ98438.1 predicted protein [Laccaria bicolor S238N-H82]|eukprot:XP_001890912.1 predicted protein [Laccaria bicolor S238N-H82]